MKIKGFFAPIRVGLLDHLPKMKPMEIKIYVALHLLAKRYGDEAGVAKTSISSLSKMVGHLRESVSSAVNGLTANGYLRRAEKGWKITNFTPPSSDGKTVSPVTEKPSVGDGKTVSGVTEKPSGRASKAKKTKPVTSPLEYKKSKKSKKSKKRREEATEVAANWPSWYSGIEWNKPRSRVDFKPEAEAGLSEHLKELAGEENLKLLTKLELQRGWGRLNGWLLRNRQCRGPKSLPPIVVNWFENDLRDPYRSRSPTSKRQQTDDIFDEAVRIAEEKEREERND